METIVMGLYRDCYKSLLVQEAGLEPRPLVMQAGYVQKVCEDF